MGKSPLVSDGECQARSRNEEKAMQGHRRRREAQRSSASSIRGFTLIEVMFSLVFLLVAAMALLQGLELAFRHYSLTQNRWKATVELWNQTEEIRATRSSGGEPLQIIPDSRPLYRRVLKDGRLEGHPGWEVLSAEK